MYVCTWRLLELSFFKYSAKNSFVMGHQTSAHWTLAMYQVQPIGLIQFWPNQKIQICNPLIFSYKCCCNDHKKENFQEKEEIENAIFVTSRRFKLSIITKRILSNVRFNVQYLVNKETKSNIKI